MGAGRAAAAAAVHAASGRGARAAAALCGCGRRGHRRLDARDALTNALPLESIELQGALAAALDAAGAQSKAATLRDAAHVSALQLATTLDDAALRERFAARHRALIGAA
jgi:hypothetical protein